MALEQPKKPVGGAYGAFMNEKRPEFKKACEGKPVSEISKMAGDEWKKLSDAEKAPYQKKYEAAKAKFDKDIAAFLAAGGEKTKGAAALRAEKKKAKSGNGKKAEKDPNKPKKPAGGAYGVFLAENRAKITKSLPTGHKMTDVSKAASVQWKALSESAKEPYVVAYGKKAEEYQKALEAYKAANPTGAVDEEEEDDEEDEGDEEEENDEGASTKRPASAGASETPTAKRGRAASKAKSSSSADPLIDAAVLKEADALGMTSQLKNLVSRPDVQASGKSQKEMLAALQSSAGLVNKAKSILLGA